MGNAVGAAANGVAAFFGNTLFAPFRSLLDVSCDGVCAGTWDAFCFIDHLCALSLGKLILFLVLSYLMLLVMWKLGGKCVLKSACKTAMAACSCCCHAMAAAPCYLWRALRSTRRVRRGLRRRRDDDVEEGRGGGGGWGGSSSGFGWSSNEEEEEEEEEEGGSPPPGGGEYGGGRRRHGRSGGGGARKQERMRRSLRLRPASFKEKAVATAARRSRSSHGHGESGGGGGGRRLRRVGSSSRRM
ncbi:hypothetical protein OsJ_01192 [Oryza sativa Japonica Group]|uniref:Uncharacterized protein n=1 Tax=Oryza sativa subsp. japonica TaxID=39947 RepID=A2ZRI1_ORYSJ|nr:hypothetical protein OsJ_01192 [Oryza sativa Japonica Group]